MTVRCPAAALLLAALVLLPTPAAGQAGAGADAFLDPGARELLDRARERRATMDTRIRGYQVQADERVSAWVRIAGRERLLLRRETASRIEWSLDTVRIEVLGARETQPMVQQGVGLPPASMAGLAPTLAFDPVDSEMLFRVDSTLVLHPLTPGSESEYRFASGEDLTISLPDGREIRLLELRIIARRADPRLINGSFWLDSETHAVARAAFRLTTPRSGSGSSVSFLTPETTTEVDHVTINYGLWDLRWWLPRSLVARGSIEAAGIRFPLEYYRSYGPYQVDADTLALTPARGEPGASRPCRPVLFGSFELGPAGAAPPSEGWDTRWNAAAERIRADSTGVDRGDGCDRVFLVTRTEGDLSQSPVFTWSIHDPDGGALPEAERRAALAMARQIPQGAWSPGAPRLRVFPLDGVRYNRVEGLSAPLRGTVPLGPGALQGELRMGTAGEVGGELSLVRSGPGGRTGSGGRSGDRVGSRIAGSGNLSGGVYRRVETTALPSHPFTPLSSLSGLLLGRDENDYFRATGAELRMHASFAPQREWEVRIFTERHAPLRPRASASLRGLFDRDLAVRENLEAEEIHQWGATVRARREWGTDPTAVRFRGEIELHGEFGDRDFFRLLVRLRGEHPMGSSTRLSLAGVAGVGMGDLPVQRRWQIGGAETVRGHDPASLRGASVYLARGEVSRGSPSRAFSLFADLGWAGEQEALRGGRPLKGVGVGLSLYDDSLRMEVARGVGSTQGEGVRLYFRYGAGR